MNYSDNNSLCSFNPVDYIDLDTALAEEELASITHSSSRNVNNYRFSLRSIDDKDLDSFRRSLITPMSVNSKVQDPMYANLINTRQWNQHSPPTSSTKNHMIKRQNTTSPTHSCNESVTESVALFNNILNDDGVDLVKSDLKDFMSPYDMDDLISRPGSRLPNTTPSPQNIGRFNRDALVSRHFNQQVTTPEKSKTPRYTNIERESNLNDNLLTSTNMDTKDKVTPTLSKPNPYNNTVLGRGRKSSVDASVQTQSPATIRKLSTATVQVDDDELPRQISQYERKQKTPSLLKLSKDQQIYPSPPATTVNTKIKRSDDRRRWSSHTISYTDNVKDVISNEDTTKSRLSAINPLSNRYNHKSINTTATTNNSLPSNIYTKEKRLSADTSTSTDQHKQQPIEQRYSSTNRSIERRASQRNFSLANQQPTSDNLQRSNQLLDRRASQRKSLLANQQPTNDNLQRSNQLLDRRASNRNSLILDQSISRQVEKTQPLPSRDLDRHISIRTSRALPPTNHQKENNEQRSKFTMTNSNRTTHLERRSSYVALSLINKDSIELGKKNELSRGQEKDITSRSVQRRSSHREFSLTNQSSSNSASGERRDISSSIPSRRIERRSSIQESSSNNAHQQLTTNAKNMKRYSYHGGYGSPPRIDIELTEDATEQPATTKSEQQKRRTRALSVPSNSHSFNEQVLKPSLMPVPVSRFRKNSNNSLSRYETVPENDIAPPAKGVRFSFNDREENIKNHQQQQQQEEVLPVSSRSTGGYSYSTASSSHSSGDIEYDPPTPPSSFIDRHDNINKRRSIPNFPSKEAPRLNRYGSYLARLKDTYETVPTTAEETEKHYIEPIVSRRQRVVSEDNESYKVQQRRQQQQSQNAVAESARQLLAQVQKRRAKTAAILNGIYGP